MVRNQPTVRETQVQFLGCKDGLEKRMSTHSGILAWEVPWTEEPGGLWTGWQGGLACCSPWGRQELDTTWRLNKQIEIIRSM